jgi:hypothetical protein
MNFPPKGNLLRVFDQQMKMFQVCCSEMPDMKVRVREGSFWDNGTNFVEFPGGTSKVITAPRVGCKIVLIGVNTAASIVILDGEVVTANPRAPECPKNVLPCAMILLQSTSTAITQEMIFDCRPVFYTRYPVSHNDLTYRNAENAHNIEAITGLVDALTERPNVRELQEYLNDKADLNGTDSPVFMLNKNGSGVVTFPADIVFQRGDNLNAILRFDQDPEGGLKFSKDNGTTWLNVQLGNDDMSDYYTKEEVDGKISEVSVRVSASELKISNIEENIVNIGQDISALHQSLENANQAIEGLNNSKEDKFEKNSAFNKNFGIEAGTVAEGNHSHASISKTLYVDSNAVDEDGNGSILKPFKTVRAASLIAVDGDLIRIATGTYNEEDITFATGVSIQGETVKALINANVTFGTVDALDHSPVSIRDITFGKKSNPKNIAINYTSEIFNCNFYGPVQFNNATRSATLMNCNFRCDNANPAITFSGTMYNQILGTINNDTGKAMLINAGQVSLNTVIVNSKSTSETINVGSNGSLNVIASQISNSSTGKAIDGTNAKANGFNAIMSSIIDKDVEFGERLVLVNGVKLMSGDFNGNRVVKPDDNNIPTNH